MFDFTLHAYRELLVAIKNAGYNFITFGEWCKGNATGKFVILRHDIDKLPANALSVAAIENELGICSTFFFQISPEIFKPGIIKEISRMGHEIGYHYRDLVDASGDSDKAISSFRNNLSKLRAVAEIKTISMDGCPWSKYDNRDLWQKYNYRNEGIVGEPYFDFLNRPEVLYLTDTARMWDGDKYNIRDRVPHKTSGIPVHSTFDLIQYIKSNPAHVEMMITTHPQRWTNKPIQWLAEFVGQRIKNRIKRFFF